MIANLIDQAIKEAVEKILSQKNIPDTEYVATDSFGEVIEKLVILHIRTWMLEDAIQAAKTNDEVAELKKKIDVCFKVKRPRFVQAINLMVDDAIARNKSLVENSVKLYKGIDSVQ